MMCNCYNSNNTQDDLRLVKGNDFATLHDIFPKYPDGTSVEDFDLADVTELTILVKRNNGSAKDVSVYCESNSITAPKQIRIDWDGLKMGIGSYRFDFSGKFQGKDWRSYSKNEGFGIVESNEEANIPVGSFIADGVYQIKTDFLMTYQTQEQADWDEEDTHLPSYIKNKPNLNVYVEKEAGKDLSDNNYSDEEKQKVDNAVPNTREVNGKALNSDITLTSSDIGALPTSTKYGYSIDLTLNSQDFKLTATLKDQDGNSLNSKMVDLPLETVVVSGRYDSTNKVIVLTLQNGNPIDIPVGDLVRGLQSEITPSRKLSSDLVDDTNSTNKFVSASEKTSWDSKQDELVSGENIKTINGQSLLGSGNIDIEGGGSGGDENVIEIVKVNNVALTPDENKAVNVSVPTQLSQLIEDTTHRVVTDAEKTTWNNKQQKLVSGTNIKTINNESILGSGNIKMPSEGMVINTISLGVDNTDKLMYVYVNGVKQGTGIDVAEVVGMPRTITYTLGINMQSSNTATKTTQGQSYTSIISSTNPDYLVDAIAVTMGGIDVSSSVVNGNTIYIPRVTGNITITVTAKFFASVDIDNAYLEIKTEQTGTLKVKLHAQPANNQSVEVNGTNLTVSPSTLTFTPSNWNTWQDVTITTGSVDDTEYGYVVITNSDPLMTETTATVEIEPMGYEDYVDTTIPTEGMHTVTAADFNSTSVSGNYIRLENYNATYDNIKIPATIDGKTCLIIADDWSSNTFRNNTTIKYVTFEDGVVYGTGSGCSAKMLFLGCTSLIGVSNMNPATTSLKDAFKDCSSLKFVDNLDELVNVTNMARTFSECSSIEYIQDLSEFESITTTSELFKNCSSLIKIFGFPTSFNANDISFANYYNGCNVLKKAYVPQGVNQTGWGLAGLHDCIVEIYEDNLSTSALVKSSTFYNSTNITVYCNANTTTYDSLITNFGSSTQITIKTFGGDAKPSIVVWGDSISSPNKAWIEWPARLQTKLGTSQYLVKNEALAGEWSTSTTARQGGYVMTTNAFTIPADTTPVLVTITVNGNETFSASPLFSCGMSYNPCTINGVDGILSREGAEYFFTRKEAGTAKSVSAGTVIVSDNDTVFNNANNIMLFYLNGNAGWDDNPSKLLDMCQKAVNHFTALGGTKYIVAGLANLFATTSVSLAEQFEELAVEAFGSHFLNLRIYEIQNGLTQNNLTASTLDVERMTEGRVPASLVGGGSDINILMYDGVNVTDQVHPNAYGANTIMLAFYDKGVSLGYWSSQP